jgi:hypothetical protein
MPTISPRRTRAFRPYSSNCCLAPPAASAALSAAPLWIAQPKAASSMLSIAAASVQCPGAAWSGPLLAAAQPFAAVCEMPQSAITISCGASAPAAAASARDVTGITVGAVCSGSVKKPSIRAQATLASASDSVLLGTIRRVRYLPAPTAARH